MCCVSRGEGKQRTNGVTQLLKRIAVGDIFPRISWLCKSSRPYTPSPPMDEAFAELAQDRSIKPGIGELQGVGWSRPIGPDRDLHPFPSPLVAAY